MCGLFGFIPSGSIPCRLDVLTQAAQQAEQRGPHAWGYSLWSIDRWMCKRFNVSFSATFKDRASWPLRVNAPLIGHCRLATGHERKIGDVQPLQISGQLVIAHNGTVPDHLAVAAREELMLQTENDSEVLGLLVEKQGSVWEALEKLPTNPLALLVGDSGSVLAYRRRHPLYILERVEGLYIGSVSFDNACLLLAENTLHTWGPP